MTTQVAHDTRDGSTANGAESSGDGWKVYPHREAGKLVAYIVAVNVAPGVRRKPRIPREMNTPELRRDWAKDAADELRAMYQAELAAKATSAAPAAEPKPGPKPPKTDATKVTFAEVAKLWTSGDLAQRFPDHVKKKKTSDVDASRLEVLCNLLVGVTVDDPNFIDHANRAMAGLPERAKTVGTRRHYAGLIARVMNLAVWPLRVIDRNPLPRNFVPSANEDKAKVYVYPSEDAQLMGQTLIPLWRRLLFGVLAREGMRVSEALNLTWSCLDLERGVLTLDENKTDDPRAWALNKGVMRALAAWKKIHPAANVTASGETKIDPKALVFVEENGGSVAGKPFARLLRDDLTLAGVTRAQLFAKGKNRLPIRAHDLRGTFVTLSLANGKTEAWVRTRTGHQSSAMIALYTTVAKTADELDLGELSPLDDAIPELHPKKLPPTNGGPGTDEREAAVSVDVSATSAEGTAFASVPLGSAAATAGTSDARTHENASAENRTLNPLVSGSSPGWPTRFAS